MTTTTLPTDVSALPGLTAWLCTPDQPPRAVVTAQGRPQGSVLWIEVGPGADVSQVRAGLRALDVAVSGEDVDALLERDEMPVLQEHGAVRNVSLVGLVTAVGRAGTKELVFETVETLAGDGWLVTFWHQSRMCGGRGDDEDVDVQLADTVRAEVVSAWTGGGLSTAGDLATAYIAALTCRYRRAFADIEDRLRVWERDFHVHGHDRAGEQLKPLIGMVNEAQRRLTAFNCNRSSTSDSRWFADADPNRDAQADHHLDKMLHRLDGLQQAIRADMELVGMGQLALATKATQEAAQRDEQFNTRLGLITAFLLVPTLIAGVFGANTTLPGGHTWWGFGDMVTLMVLTAPAVWWLIVRNSRSAR